jgi:hypothetical protein
LSKKETFGSTDIDGAEIVDRLRKAVDDAGGPAAVCRAAGVPMSTLSGYLNGTEARFTRMAVLAKACKVSLDWLAYGEENTNRLNSLAIFQPEVLNASPHFSGLVLLIAGAQEYHRKMGLKPCLLDIYEWISPHYLRAMSTQDISFKIIPDEKVD